MDAINFLSNRQMNPEDIFSTSQTMTECEEDVSGSLKNLENLLEKQVKTWWDIFTFKHYEKENLIFRSLRWEVSPQDGLIDQKYMDEWLEFFNRRGRELQALVLKRKNIKLEIVNQKIKAIQATLEPVKESNQL